MGLCFLKSTRVFFMIFGNNVSHLVVGKRTSHVSMPCPVFNASCCPSLPLVVECEPFGSGIH